MYSYVSKISPLPTAMLVKENGFTLVELMVSLVLGLLISAAVVQIYITNVRTSTIQKSGSELQDASVFGIQQLEAHIRLANLGNSNTQITDATAFGGVVLSGKNIGNPSYSDVAYLTRSTDDSGTSDNGWTGISNTDKGSDQLTIQFTNTTENTIPDCEGNDIAVNDTVIERFYLRRATSDNDTKSPGDVKNIVLACDAGRLTGTGVDTTHYTGSDQRVFGNAGQEFIVGVDQFKILLGTQYTATTAATAATSTTSATSATTEGQVQYITPHDYTILNPKPAIVSIKIGLITHGSTPIPTVVSGDATNFTVLGDANTLKSDTNGNSKKVRTTYDSTVILRNARVLKW